LKWVKVKDAKNYIIQVSNDTYFQRPIIDDDELIDPGYQLTIDSRGTYFWQVRSVSETGRASSWTDFWSFRALPADVYGQEITTTKPPKLTIEDIRQKGYMIIIKGKTDPGVTLLVNDEKKEVNEDGSFTAYSTWEETMNVDVFDTHGNVTSEKISMEQDRY